jgi:competence protein ComEA
MELPPTPSVPSQPNPASAGQAFLSVQNDVSGNLPPNPSPVNVMAVWPRSAQLATAFLLGLALALLLVQMWSMSRWNTRPLELDRGKSSGYRIDLNQADHAQLLQVPGIGERTAEKIEVYRKESGSFGNKGELTQVRGIGPAKFEKMTDWLTTQTDNAVITDNSIASQTGKSSSDTFKASRSRSPSKKGDALKEAIDVNHADSMELQKLPGIGPKISQRILDERAKSPFRSVEDLRRVPGIGPKVLEGLRPYVKLGEAPDRVAVKEAREQGKR